MTAPPSFVVRERAGASALSAGAGTAAAGGAGPGDALFPDGRSRLVLGDALVVAPHLPAGCVDLVYLDPPFATGRERRGRGAGAPGGERGAAPADAPGPTNGRLAYGDRWEGGLGAYLDWLAALLGEAHRLLAPTGSLVLHLDWHAAHAARLLLDALFGPERFVNEIVWHYGSGGRARRHFHRKHDTLLWYARGPRYRFFPEAVAVDRRQCPACGGARDKWNHLRRHQDADGRTYRTIRSAGREYRYYDDAPVLPPDVWLDVSHLQQKDPERLGWPTQKPLALLRRVLDAATAPGDVVADLCCGSGTTLAAAQGSGRRFLGVDAAPEAVGLAWERLAGALPADAAGLALETCGVEGWGRGGLAAALGQGTLRVTAGQPTPGRALALVAGLLGGTAGPGLRE